MSNQLVSLLYYVYKLTFSTGETYVGCHVQKKSNDKYITSSSFYKNHKDVPFIREILIYVKDYETLCFMETVCIMQDKCQNPKNVNGNFGNFVMKFAGRYKGFHQPQSQKDKLSQWHKTSGYHHSKETIEKLKRPCSEEAKKKISETLKRKYSTGELKPPCSKSMLGKKHSEETKRKMSEARRNAPKRKCYTDGKSNIRLTEDMPIPEGFHPGRTVPKGVSEKQKDLIWYTNGQKNVRLHKNEIPPEGFYRGSTQIRKVNRQTP